MDVGTILTLIGILLANGAALIAAWIKIKTDITAINVKLADIDERVKQQEMHNNKIIDKLDERFEKFVGLNDTQHIAIAGKVDLIKDIVNELKVEMAKVTKHQ